MCILYTLHDALNVVNGQYEFWITSFSRHCPLLKNIGQTLVMDAIYVCAFIGILWVMSTLFSSEMEE